MNLGLFLTGSSQVPLAYKKYTQFISLVTRNYCCLETVLTNTNLVFVLAVDNIWIIECSHFVDLLRVGTMLHPSYKITNKMQMCRIN